jgi:hypothetical protein
MAAEPKAARGSGEKINTFQLDDGTALFLG